MDTVNVRNGLLEFNQERTRAIYESQSTQMGSAAFPGFDWYRDEFLLTLRMHPMYYIAPDMMTLAENMNIAAVADNRFSFEPYDLPSHRGFMYFPSGHQIVDARGFDMVHHAVAWWRAGPDMVVFAWLTDKNDKRDWSNMRNMRDRPELWAKGDQFEFSALTISRFGPQKHGQYTVRLKDGSRLPEDLFFRFLPDSDNSDVKIELYRIDEGTGKHIIDTETEYELVLVQNDRFSVLLTVMHLMKQTIASVTDEKPPRHALKRSVRLRAETKLTVIELRHVSRQYREGAGMKLDHRYLRRSHWRRQPYKDSEGQWRRKWILIRPTIVGPEDKPLIIREHINSLVR